MKEKFIIDRIEGENVILENEEENIISITNEYIVGIPKEGDVLIKEGEKYVIDEDATKARRKKIEILMKGMWNE